ncbi:hypothetical protein ACHAXT_001571 [Thalassiosira profunda]
MFARVSYAVGLASLLGADAASYATIDPDNSGSFPCFRSMEGMRQSMEDLADGSDLVTITDIGESWLKENQGSGRQIPGYAIPEDGHDIYAVKVTDNSASGDKGKMLLTAGVHAREWAPPELVARFLEMLVNGYEVDADITWILKHVEVHAILYVNPDGRHMAERYPELRWRKNMNPEGGCADDESYGTDINRNQNFFWSHPGASDDPCASDYHGDGAESEPESKALADYARSLFPSAQRKDKPEDDKDVAFPETNTGMFVDVHSSGGYVYYPWGHVDLESPNNEALEALGRKMHYFNDYKLWAGGKKDFLYAASGDISDFMYGSLGVASMGFEIGDDWQQDCSTFESDVVPINLPALLHAAKVAAKPFLELKGPDVMSLDASQSNGQIAVSAFASDSEMVNAFNGPEFTTGAQDITEVLLYLDVHPDDYSDATDTRWSMQPVRRRLQACPSIKKRKPCKRTSGCEWLTTTETCRAIPPVVCTEITKKGRCNRAGGGGVCFWDSDKTCKPDKGGSPSIADSFLSGSGEESVELSIDTSTLSTGRHTLYVQAMDSDGYKGPVSSVFVDVSRRRLRGGN